MKIDREKLSVLLKSGLHPEINTRKKLAAEMGLDPTSITRWFAVRDRLGNPRYPVIPDRHVNRILDIFNAKPQWLNLDNDAFRQQCFEAAITQTKKAKLTEQERALRLKRIEQRRLVIDNYTLDERNWLSWKMGLTVVISLTAATMLVLFSPFAKFKPNTVDSIETNVAQQVSMGGDTVKEKCWRGYSSMMGNFEKVEPSDPCHYAKLMHLALAQLQESNLDDEITNNSPFESLNAHHDFLMFLSTKLDQRRAKEHAILHIELTKSELKRKNIKAAKNYLKLAQRSSENLSKSHPQIVAELTKLANQIAQY